MGLVGTWKDAEDGHLQGHAIEQGSVDSTVGFNISVKANSDTVLYFWICAGQKMGEVKRIHEFIVKETPEKLLKNTINYWVSWVNKEPEKISDIPKELQKIYKQNLLILRTQIDNKGAIIASTDLDIMKFNKDTYTYMWPRDGAWVSLALDRAGYGEISRRFFEFCAEIVTKDGYLLPKYNPDLSVGSSWHPSIKNGINQLPIQEDETGIVLFALFKHYQNFGDIEFMQKMYLPLIHGMGSFLMEFRDKKTRLPLPSYDLWERERGISAYTCSTVYAGLMSAAYLSQILGHFNHHRRYEKAAYEVREAILKYLYDEKKNRFLKRIEIDEKTGEITKDYIIDASMHALWMFGVLPPEDDRIFDTNQAIFKALSVNTDIGGLTRYENDDYQRVDNTFYGSIPGNPWIITTLWHAQWLLSIAKNKEGLKPVEKYINWAINHMNEAGILPEQLNPFNGDHLSVSPLTWSHAAFVDTVLMYNDKLKELS
jgi:GH15 family glucan-1,4-alpha-glucosidase